ncbi:hypothetical protein FN846DRAFT_1003962 [Sphaerosporella brunnea]|uniref:Hemerythrin-like domain-containing protein n=1 Tax=Sphaerosporella brunnea TaxID=1250544 RepID=A0A5J5EDN3_9PEZI|nr:hypothetical protein FN846DRAFT_1003962 [Sphaerosporella brunnea]
MPKTFQNKWADTPFALIPTPIYQGEDKTDSFVRGASEMALVHNCIIRGLNSIYLQAPYLSPSDHADFILYAQGWSGVIHAHHEGEETIIFPTIEEKTGQAGIMSTNVAQHQAFSTGLSAFDTYLLTPPSDFSGPRLVEIIDDFAPSLVTHLTEEIATLLALKEYRGSVDIVAIMEAEGEKIMKNINKTLFLSFMAANLDVTFEDGIHTKFPPAPWFVKFLMHWVWPLPKRRVWRFGSTTPRGVPKELPLAPKKEEEEGK